MKVYKDVWFAVATKDNSVVSPIHYKTIDDAKKAKSDNNQIIVSVVYNKMLDDDGVLVCETTSYSRADWGG